MSPSLDAFAYGFRIHESICEASENPLAVKRLCLMGKSWIDHDSNLLLESCAELLKQTANLREFQVGWVPWTELPGELGKLRYLRKVSVLNAPIKQFPDFLAACSKLSELTLRGTGISQIPASISDFHRMRYLDISNNPIRDLPQKLKYLPQLQTLRLHSTGIKNQFIIGAQS